MPPILLALLGPLFKLFEDIIGNLLKDVLLKPDTMEITNVEGPLDEMPASPDSLGKFDGLLAG